MDSNGFPTDLHGSPKFEATDFHGPPADFKKLKSRSARVCVAFSGVVADSGVCLEISRSVQIPGVICALVLPNGVRDNVTWFFWANYV